MNKVLTANRLSDGIAVWLGANGQWIETLDTALIARHQEAVDALEEAGKAAFNRNLVVDIDLIAVEEVDGDEDAASGADAGLEPLLLSMTGSQSTEIEPLSGADCTPAVAALGGPFLSLPCRVEYVLTGSGITVE